LAVIKPSHDRAGVGPADVENQVGIGVHPRTLHLLGVLGRSGLELAQVGRTRAMASRALLQPERADVLAVSYLLRERNITDSHRKPHCKSNSCDFRHLPFPFLTQPANSSRQIAPACAGNYR